MCQPPGRQAVPPRLLNELWPVRLRPVHSHQQPTSAAPRRRGRGAQVGGAAQRSVLESTCPAATRCRPREEVYVRAMSSRCSTMP
jgi:hypothetical protein